MPFENVSKRRKASLAAVLVVAIFLGMTAYEWVNMPFEMNVYKDPFDKSEAFPLGLLLPKSSGGPTEPGSGVVVQNYSVSFFGNSVQICVYVQPNMQGTQEVSLTGPYFSVPVIVGNLAVWISNETRKFPFSSLTVKIDSLQVGVNSSTVFNDTPGFKGSNLANYLVSSLYYRPGGTFGGGQAGAFGGEMDGYWFLTNQDGNVWQELNPGNYTYYVNVTMTPIALIGPYAFYGNQFTSRITFVQDYVN